jgi:hypothetical protein
MFGEKSGGTSRLRAVASGLMAFAVVAIGVITLPAVASAAPPANDEFASAQVIGPALPISVNGTNVGATAESGEPAHDNGQAANSVWYRWTSPTSGQEIINICNADRRMRWAFYTGSSVSALTLTLSSVQGHPCEYAAVNVTAGTTYSIAVDSYSQPGSFTLQLREHGTPPANDNFADAQPLNSSLPLTVGGSNEDATAESGEPSHGPDPAEQTVWYSWTSPITGLVKLDLCESDNSKNFAVYTGTVISSLTRVTDDGGGCSRTFPVTTGVDYKIALDFGVTFIGGGLRLTLRTADPPSNDSFGTPIALPDGLDSTTAATNVDATAQTGEPDNNGAPAGKSVWFTWTAPDDVFSEAWVDVCSSDFVARIAVFTGSSVGGLTPVPSESGSYYCHFFFVTDPGQTYRIAVDGRSAGSIPDEGTIDLRLFGDFWPFNDDVDNAQPIPSTLPASVDGFTVGATDEPDEPSHGGVDPLYSVWYEWTAPSSGPITIDTCDSDFDSLLSVYSAGSGGLESLGESDDSEACSRLNEFGSSVPLNTQAGTSYLIAVDGWDQGSFELAIKPVVQQASPAPVTPVTPHPPKRKCRKAKKHGHKRCKKKSRGRR